MRSLGGPSCVVILAAGEGRRLAAVTGGLPKALCVVAGRSLLLRAIQFAATLKPTRTIVVAGAGYDEVARHLSIECGSAVHLVRNARYASAGNLRSLLAAAEHLSGDIAIMNVDHVYSPRVGEWITTAAADITLLCDSARALGADDMKVQLGANRHVQRIAKSLSTWDCGYVGLTLIPAARLSTYVNTGLRLVDAGQESAHVEDLVQALIEQGLPVTVRDIGTASWWEVDTPEDYHVACAALRR